MTYAFALFAREFKRFQKLWLDTVMSPIISVVLYLAVFGIVMGEQTVAGLGYLEFIYSGLLAMIVINSSFANPSFGLIISKNLGTFVDLQLAPLAPWKINLAYAGAATIRAAFTAAIALLATAWFIPGFGIANVPFFLAGIALTGLELGLLGMAFGMHARSFESMTFMSSFVMQPMIFLSGVFYPIGNLPGIWGTIAAFNPLHHNVNIVRYAMTGYSDGNHLVSLAVVMSLIALLLVITQIVTSRKIRT